MERKSGMTAEEAFELLQKMIEDTVIATTALRTFRGIVLETDKYHRSIGFDGMAHKAQVCKKADPERWEAMRSEYTDRCIEMAKAMREAAEVIFGVIQGSEETFAAKRAMEN